MPAFSNQTETPLLVPELMARVRKIQIRTHRLVNTAIAGGYRSTFRGQGIEFEEVRPYQPGDEVRSIDWNVTARTGEPYVKAYTEERELTIHLLVDTALAMDFGSEEWTKREAAAQFAALISFVAIRHQDRIGLTLFGPEPGLHLPGRKTGRDVLRLIREVIAAPTTVGGSDLSRVLETAERVLHRRSMVFVVSDFLANERGHEWGDVLARLARRHDVIAVRVVDPLEEELPEAGLFLARSIDGGELIEIDSSSEEVREAWSEHARSRRSRLMSVLTKARVDAIELAIGKNIADPVIEFFHRRSMRYGRGGH